MMLIGYCFELFFLDCELNHIICTTSFVQFVLCFYSIICTALFVRYHYCIICAWLFVMLYLYRIIRTVSFGLHHLHNIICMHDISGWLSLFATLNSKRCGRACLIAWRAWLNEHVYPILCLSSVLLCRYSMVTYADQLYGGKESNLMAVSNLLWYLWYRGC